MTRPPEDPTGATARARQRIEHRKRCVPDPPRPGKRINPEPDAPHGTGGGHDNWGCQCAVVRPWHLLTSPDPPPELSEPPRPDEQPGCEPVAVAAAARRRQSQDGPAGGE
jgi:hypothetical protein